MKRRKLILISIAGCLLLFCWWLHKTGYYAFWNKNSVTVIADPPLSKDLVKVEFGFNSINRETDEDLFTDRGRYTVLYDGGTSGKMLSDYGENDFLLTYDDKYYVSFRHFIFNRRDYHDHYFHFFKIRDSLMVSVSITGPSPMKFEHVLREIRDAKRFRCNVPIDSAGDVYNMIDLENPKKK